jgi:hypothetical protein
VIAQPCDDIEEFLKRDETSAILQLVVVDSVGQLGDFRAIRTVSVPELSTLPPTFHATIRLPTIHEFDILIFFDLLRHDSPPVDSIGDVEHTDVIRLWVAESAPANVFRVVP